MTVDIEDLRKHVGRMIEDHDQASAAPMRGLTVTLERSEPELCAGMAIPPGWHIAYFLPMAPRAKLAADGLPIEAGVLPQMPFPRRMFGGTHMTFHAPILVGDKLRRETELSDIQARSGSTGTIIFTTQTRRIYTPRGLAVTEEYDTAFREEVKAGAKSGIPKRESPPADTPWRRSVNVDILTLFRFSAVTFNAHRIHYDRPYAINVEGYPGLVVTGPLLQTYLIDFVRDQNPGKTLRTFVMRAKAPLFDSAPFTLVGRPINGGADAEVWAVTPEGTIAMQATATLM